MTFVAFIYFELLNKNIGLILVGTPCTNNKVNTVDNKETVAKKDYETKKTVIKSYGRQIEELFSNN